MKNRILAGCLAFTLLAVAGILGASAQEKIASKPAVVEKTGVIEIIPADKAKKEKFDQILLKVGEESIVLIPGKGEKKEFKNLEKLAGKTVTVTGDFLPANPPKHPRAAIRVAKFAEVAAAKPAAPENKPAEPAKK